MLREVVSLSRGGGTQCTSEGVGVYKAAAQIVHALEHVGAQYVDELGGQSMWKNLVGRACGRILLTVSVVKVK